MDSAMRIRRSNGFTFLMLLLALLAFAVISCDYTFDHTQISPSKHFLCKLRNAVNTYYLSNAWLLVLFTLNLLIFLGFLDTQTKLQCSSSFRRIVAPRPPPANRSVWCFQFMRFQNPSFTMRCLKTSTYPRVVVRSLYLEYVLLLPEKEDG